MPVQIVTVDDPGEINRVFDPQKVNYFIQDPKGERIPTHYAPFKILGSMAEDGTTRRLYVCMGRVWDSGANEVKNPPDWFWEQAEDMLKRSPKCFDGYGGLPKRLNKNGGNQG